MTHVGRRLGRLKRSMIQLESFDEVLAVFPPIEACCIHSLEVLATIFIYFSPAVRVLRLYQM